MGVDPIQLALSRSAHHEQHTPARSLGQLVHHGAEHQAQKLPVGAPLDDAHAATRPRARRSRCHSTLHVPEQYSAGARVQRSAGIGSEQRRQTRAVPTRVDTGARRRPISTSSIPSPSNPTARSGDDAGQWW